MFKFIFLYIFLLPGLLASDDDTTRIIEGVPCKYIHMPLDYVVSLSTMWGYHFCGGALFKPSYVLTAAHCFYANVGTVYVIIFRDSSNRKVIQVKKTYSHPLFNMTSNKLHDIGIAKLAYELTPWYRFKYAQLISKPVTVPMETFCSEALLAGWGYIDNNYRLPDSLMCVKIPVISVNACTTRYKRPHAYDFYVCTFSEKGKDGCQGDSGAPLICHKTGEVIGVHSYGVACGDRKSPAVSTRVDQYLDFIRSTVMRSASSIVSPMVHLIVLVTILCCLDK